MTFGSLRSLSCHLFNRWRRLGIKKKGWGRKIDNIMDNRDLLDELANQELYDLTCLYFAKLVAALEDDYVWRKNPNRPNRLIIGKLARKLGMTRRNTLALLRKVKTKLDP